MFEAKNNIKSKKLYVYRKYYKASYPEQYTNIIDMWSDSFLYGKVNEDLNTLSLNKNYLKPLKDNSISSNSQNFALNIVADSFYEFIAEVQKADRLKLIPKSKLNPLRVTKSYNSTQNDYNNKVIEIFNSMFIQNELLNNIFTIDNFLNKFCFYVTNIRVPYTETAYINSNLHSPFNTGLVIDFSNLKHDYDNPKFEDYLSDENYEFFHNTAQKYSFFVDKNAPWRIVYNVTTDYALQKYKSYNINSLNELQTTFYTPTYLTDWKKLKDILLNYYQDKVYRKPSVQIPDYCDGNVVFNTVKKEIYDSNKYEDIFWIKLYYFVRLNEQQISMTQQEFESKLKYITGLYSSSGERDVLEFINKQTKSFVDGGKNPSYSDVIRLQKNKLLSKSSFTLKL